VLHLQNAVVGLVGEEDVALAVGSGAFGELEAVGQQFDLGAGGGDAACLCLVAVFHDGDQFDPIGPAQVA